MNIGFEFNTNNNEVKDGVRLTVPTTNIIKDQVILNDLKSNGYMEVGLRETEYVTQLYFSNHYLYWAEIINYSNQMELHDRVIFDNFVENCKNGWYKGLVKIDGVFYQPMTFGVNTSGYYLGRKTNGAGLFRNEGRNVHTTLCIIPNLKIDQNYFLVPLSKSKELTLDNILELLYDIGKGIDVGYQKEFLLDKYEKLTGGKYQ